MKNNIDIDQIIKEGMANFEPAPPLDAWNFIEKQMQGAPAPSGQGNQFVQAIQQTSLLGKIVAVVGVSLVSVGLYFGLNQKETAKVELPSEIKPIVEQPLVTAEDSKDLVVVENDSKTNIKKTQVKIGNTKPVISNPVTEVTNELAPNVVSENSSVQTENKLNTSIGKVETSNKDEAPVIIKRTQDAESKENKKGSERNEAEPIFTSAFSPDGDGKNDTWMVQLDHAAYFHLTIIDAMSQEIVFESNEIKAAWNGTSLKTGVDCVGGKYAYIVDYQVNENNERRTKRGIIHLLR